MTCRSFLRGLVTDHFRDKYPPTHYPPTHYPPTHYPPTVKQIVIALSQLSRPETELQRFLVAALVLALEDAEAFVIIDGGKVGFDTQLNCLGESLSGQAQFRKAWDSGLATLKKEGLELYPQRALHEAEQARAAEQALAAAPAAEQALAAAQALAAEQARAAE